MIPIILLFDLKKRIAISACSIAQSNYGLTCYKGERGLKVNVVCLFNPNLNLKDVYDVVNTIKTTISQLDQRIKKVFVHAEPAITY